MLLGAVVDLPAYPPSLRRPSRSRSFGVEPPPAGRGTDAPPFAHGQNRTYSRPGSPSGRRRPVFGWRIQPVGSRSMPTRSRIHAATAASAESYHHSSSTKVWFFALRSRRRPRPYSRAMMSHVGLAAGSRRAGRARVAHEPFLDVARPVRRWAVVTTVGMLLVRWLRVIVDSPLAEASTRVCGARGLAHELGFRRSRGAPRPRRKPRCSARPTPSGAPARLPRQRRAVDGASVARLLDHLDPDLRRSSGGFSLPATAPRSSFVQISFTVVRSCGFPPPQSIDVPAAVPMRFRARPPSLAAVARAPSSSILTIPSSYSYVRRP